MSQEPTRIGRTPAAKEERLARMRRRFAAATPTPPRPTHPRFYRDWRGVAAIVLAVLLALAMLL